VSVFVRDRDLGNENRKAEKLINSKMQSRLGKTINLRV